MKIVLKTPFNPGDLDPGKTYPHVFISTVNDYASSLFLSFTYAYGTVTTMSQTLAGSGLLGLPGTVTVSSFMPGAGCFPLTYNAIGNEYLSIQNASMGLTGDTPYQSQMRLLYQTLLNKALVLGTISNP